MSEVDAELLAAYVRTEYRVDDKGFSFTMRIDEPSASLLACHAAHDVECSAFITAWNPRSQQQTLHENEAAMARLERHLAARDFRWLRGEGIDPRGEWPGEPSFLVLDLDRTAATAMGREFGQNAVLCAAADAIPRLALCV